MLLEDMPPRAWITTALQWIRTIALATLFLALGRVLDAALTQTDTSGALILGATTGVVAVACSGIAAAVPPRLRAVEEQRWRGSGVRAAGSGRRWAATRLLPRRPPHGLAAVTPVPDAAVAVAPAQVRLTCSPAGWSGSRSIVRSSWARRLRRPPPRRWCC